MSGLARQLFDFLLGAGEAPAPIAGMEGSLFEDRKKQPRDTGDEPLFSTTNTRDRADAMRRLAEMMHTGKKNGGTAFRIKITPAMAEVILENNPQNRAASKRHIERLAGAMKRGEWALNGEAVVIASDGSLNDGQHRLHACVKSGRTFETMLVVGVKRETRMTLDQGIKRTVGHILSMRGEKDANNLAHAARLVWQYQTFGRICAEHPTPQQIEDLLDAHPELNDSMSFGRMAYSGQKLCSSGLFSALHFIFADRDKKLADDFMEKIATGVGLTSKSSPAYRFRARLIENATSKRKYPEVEIAAVGIKAWNFARHGTPTVRALVWRSSGNGAEEFPKAE